MGLKFVDERGMGFIVLLVIGVGVMGLLLLNLVWVFLRGILSFFEMFLWIIREIRIVLFNVDLLLMFCDELKNEFVFI